MARVLIIDDDEDVTRLLQTHLSEEGHAVIITHDAKEGMAQLLRSVPDLIMLDVFLPDATGYQMCNRIRKNDATKTTPIIMMTGAARFPNQQMYGRQRGANEYIFKPFDIVEVGDLVHKYISPAATNGNGRVSAPAAEQAPAPITPENIEHISAFLKTQAARSNQVTLGEETPMIPIQPETDPLSAFGTISFEPAQPLIPDLELPAIALPIQKTPEPLIPTVPEPAQDILIPVPQSGYLPPNLGSKERFQDFGLEVYALASRLSSSHAEMYLADQLLRTSLSMASKLHIAPAAASPAEFMALTSGALRDLREAGYWLMLTRKLGLLDKLTKTDLEKTCQSLITLLNALVNEKKQ